MWLNADITSREVAKSFSKATACTVSAPSMRKCTKVCSLFTSRRSKTFLHLFFRFGTGNTGLQYAGYVGGTRLTMPSRISSSCRALRAAFFTWSSGNSLRPLLFLARSLAGASSLLQ